MAPKPPTAPATPPALEETVRQLVQQLQGQAAPPSASTRASLLQLVNLLEKPVAPAPVPVPAPTTSSTAAQLQQLVNLLADKNGADQQVNSFGLHSAYWPVAQGKAVWVVWPFVSCVIKWFTVIADLLPTVLVWCLTGKHGACGKTSYSPRSRICF